MIITQKGAAIMIQLPGSDCVVITAKKMAGLKPADIELSMRNVPLFYEEQFPCQSMAEGGIYSHSSVEINRLT